MEEVIKWLKENIGDSIEIITPQFERTYPLEYNFIPKTPKQFHSIIADAPWNILKGLGFGKWDTMNSIIAENMEKHKHETIHIPIINSTETLRIDLGYQDAPIELLEVDEDILLFPKEWYGIIPDGFIVTGLYGEQYPFEKGESDDDIRFGCLPYGIRREVNHAREV